MARPRRITTKLLALIEDDVLDKDVVILACFKYMSEGEVAEMADINEFLSDGVNEDKDDEEEGEQNES